MVWGSLVAGVLTTMIVCREVLAQSWTFGARDAGWIYGYYQQVSLRMWVVFVVTATAAALLLRLPAPHSRTNQRILLLAWWAFGLCAALMIRSVANHTMESLFTSDGASGFYGFTQQYSADSVLRHFNRLRRTGSLHVQANMPGKLMLVYALELLTTQPKWLTALVIVISSAGGILLYAFTNQLVRQPRTALLAAIFYWFLPARLFFLPIMNTVTPVAVLACACLLLWWLRTAKTLPAVLLGVALYGLTFFEPLPLVIGAAFAALVIRSLALEEMPLQRWTLQACAMVLAFMATSEAVYAATGFELLSALRQTAAHATAFNAENGRPYAFWVRANLNEFMFGVGYCQLALMGGTLAALLSSGGSLRERLTHPITTLSLGLLATLAALEAIGINRGEVIRLWIFVVCFLQLPAAYACAALQKPLPTIAVVFCSLLQTTLGTGTILFTTPQ